MKPLLTLLVLVLCSCNKHAPQSSIPENKTTQFKRQEFVTLDGANAIALVSTNECEVTDGRDILLSEYQRNGDKLRVVVKTMGTSLVQYYAIVPDGIRDERSGRMYFTPEVANKERRRLIKQAEAERRARLAQEQARLAEEKAKQQAERDRAAAVEAERVKFVNQVEERLTKMLVKGRVFDALINDRLPYEIRLISDVHREMNNGMVSVYADAVLTPKPGADGKIHLLNYFDEGKGRNDLECWIGFDMNTVKARPTDQFPARFKVVYSSPSEKANRSGEFITGYNDEAEVVAREFGMAIVVKMR